MAFTVAAVPTGMKAGVRMTPRGIRISPVRAAPSVLLTLKVKVSVVIQTSWGHPRPERSGGAEEQGIHGSAAQVNGSPSRAFRAPGMTRNVNAGTANSHRHRSRSDSLSRSHEHR